ncbi:MAG: beta-ketoacyl-ACP synthase II, partial [Bacteroidales bacterium]|nr:beta-ketoacyl-ACP synthase II [Bacteroidales bacterium]
DSKLNLDTIDKDQVGVIGASGIGGLETMDKEMIDFAKGDGTPRFNPFFIPKMIIDISAGHISMKYGFHGPNYATVSACASSSHAIIDSFMQIILGKAKVMIAGGSEAPISISGVGGFNAMHAISTKNDEYQTASRPFSKDRDGFVMAEGGAVLVLEEYEHAIKRGARSYAELVGTGASADAHHLTAPHPEGLGATKVMKAAIAEAGIQPEDIDYINTHGTSTPLGDISETKAIVSVFKEHAYKLNISSTKSMTGHLLGAAGAIEAIASVLAIKNQTVPPTINFQEPDPEIDQKLNLTFHKAQKREINYTLSNTFGFGGHNATVIFKKFDV